MEAVDEAAHRTDLSSALVQEKVRAEANATHGWLLRLLTLRLHLKGLPQDSAHAQVGSSLTALKGSTSPAPHCKLLQMCEHRNFVDKHIVIFVITVV